MGAPLKPDFREGKKKGNTKPVKKKKAEKKTLKKIQGMGKQAIALQKKKA